MSAAQTLTLASSKASKPNMEARLAELEALVKAKDAESESLRSRPGHRKAFSQRNLHAAMIANPQTTIEQLDELAKEHGITYKAGVLKMARRHALDFIELAKQAGRWS